MPLPNIVQTTDTFNTFLDATNNVISHIANTQVYVILSQTASPIASVGNGAINGSLTIKNLTVNTTCNIAGTTANVSANTNFTGTDLNIISNTSLSGATLIVGANATFSGSYLNVTTGSLRVGGDASLLGLLTVSGNVLFTGALSTVNALSVERLTTLTGAATLANTLTITGNSTFNNTVIFNSGISARGSFNSNGAMIIGGPYSANIDHIITVSISGAGPFNNLTSADLGSSNASSCKISGTTDASVTGFHAPDTASYRQVILINTGNFDITLNHEDASSTSTNRFYCPSNGSFILQKQSATTLAYDVSVQRWRILGGGAGSTNASMLSSGTVSANLLPPASISSNGVVTTLIQSFAGAKTFTGAITAASFTGAASGLTGVPAGQLTGTVPASTLPSASASANGAMDTTTQTFGGAKTFNGAVVMGSTLNVSGVVTGGTFSGSGASLTSVPAAQLTGSGTLPDGVLASNVLRTTSALNADNLSSGIVPLARLSAASASANGIVSDTTQSFAGNKTFVNNVNVGGTHIVTGATTLNSSLVVAGATTLQSTLGVTGHTTLSTFSASGAATVGGTFGITGATSLNSTLNVTGGTTVTNITATGFSNLYGDTHLSSVSGTTYYYRRVIPSGSGRLVLPVGIDYYAT